jgi:hypothetical protein
LATKNKSLAASDKTNVQLLQINEVPRQTIRRVIIPVAFWCGVVVATVSSVRQKMTDRVPGLHLRNGEFVVRHDRATLKKFVRARVGHGTRVRVPK